MLFFMGSGRNPEYLCGSLGNILYRGLLSYAQTELKGKMDAKDFRLSRDIVANFEEHSSGGFLLFVVDLEGEPEYIFRTDNTIVRLGLLSFADDILSGERFKEQEKYLDFDICDDEGEDEQQPDDSEL